VNSDTSAIEFLVAVQPDECAESDSQVQLCLSKVESLAKELLLGSNRAAKNIDRFAKEKFRRTIESELVE
jgi:hypothetical protein